MKLSKKTQDIICLVIIAVSVVAMLVLGISYSVSKKAENKTYVNTETPTLRPKEDKVKVTVNTDIIEDGLGDMGFLVTQEYYFTQVETYTKEKKVLNFFDATSELAYSYDGSVTAGVDFEKIKLERDDETKTITAIIPEAEIQTVIIDKDSFKVYTQKESMWNKMNVWDYNDSLVEFEKAATDKAIENGILERAQEQAQKLVENFIRNYQAASDYSVVCEVKE